MMRLCLSDAAGDFIRRAKSRSNDQDFFRGPTLFEPISAKRNAVMTGGRCDDGNAHVGNLAELRGQVALQALWVNAPASA